MLWFGSQRLTVTFELLNNRWTINKNKIAKNDHLNIGSGVYATHRGMVARNIKPIALPNILFLYFSVINMKNTITNGKATHPTKENHANA